MGSADVRTPEEIERGDVPRYQVKQDVTEPAAQGHDAGPLEEPVPPAAEGVYAGPEELDVVVPDAPAGEQGEPGRDNPPPEENSVSLLPRDMPPPPEVSTIFTSVDTPGDGTRLFSATAASMMIQREGVSPKNIPSRRLTSLKKLIRKQSFQQGIALTYLPEAASIFKLLVKEGQETGEMLEQLRDVLESFMAREKQEAVPAKFDEQFSQVTTLFPQFLSIAIDSPLFIYTVGSSQVGALERVNGFSNILEKKQAHPGVVIQHDGLTYGAMSVLEGYEDVLRIITERLDPEDSFVPKHLLHQAVSVAHYMYNQTATSEYI